jgi:exonuclease III
MPLTFFEKSYRIYSLEIHGGNMSKFRIISWNSHYGFTLKKLTAILEYSPDILIIQECRKNDFDVLKSNWNYKNWYNDDLNQEESELGVAIFSNEFKIHFSEIFNRKYRYVIPYTVSKWGSHEAHENALANDEIVFTLFTIWTKPANGPCFYDTSLGKKTYGYHHNVIEAMNSPEYRQYSNRRYTMLIGDFNTGSNQEDDVHKNYYKELTTGLKDFVNVAKNTEEEYKETCYNKGKFFTNDFCFISKNFDIAKTTLSVLNNWEEDANGKKSWRGFSDHCPIIVDVEILDFDVLAEIEATDNEKRIT